MGKRGFPDIYARVYKDTESLRTHQANLTTRVIFILKCILHGTCKAEVTALYILLVNLVTKYKEQ